jgi:hypothetical protein
MTTREVLEVIVKAIVAPEGGTVARRGIVVDVPVSNTACLCVACGRVSETANDCEWCGSQAMLNLSRILDRM